MNDQLNSARWGFFWVIVVPAILCIGSFILCRMGN